jgi:hypothetical protein
MFLYLNLQFTEVFNSDEKALKCILSRTALGRTAELLDLKAALIYLASPASD